MKRTVSYLIALFLGLFIGWLGQQFWKSYYLEPPSSAAQSLARQHKRLNDLMAISQQAPQQAQGKKTLEPIPSKLSQAIQQKNVDQALELFSLVDNKKLDDALLIAELLYEQEFYERLFSFLYDFRFGLDNTAELQLHKEIYRFVEKVDLGLADRDDPERAVGLYRQLISFEGDYTFYYLRLSYWLLQSGASYEASQSLLGAVNDIEFEKETRELEAAIRLYEEVGAKIEIPVKSVDEHFLVNIMIDSHISLELMLDTGASKTVIKRSLLETKIPGLLDGSSKVIMNTANGRVQGDAVTMKNFSLGKLELEQLDVILLDLQNFKYDGLLGMNLLGKFDFKIDQENLLLILSPKKPAKKLDS